MRRINPLGGSLLLLVGLAVSVGVSPVGANDGDLAADLVVYETSEIVDLFVTGTRTAPLLGSARMGNLLCLPVSAGLGGSVPCTVTGVGNLNLTTGAVTGSLAVVVEAAALNPLLSTNPADAPEVQVTLATFEANEITRLPLPDGTPRRLKEKLKALQAVGLFVLLEIQTTLQISYDVGPFAGLCGAVGSCPVAQPVRGVFRLPFALSKDGKGGDDEEVERPRRGKAAFYLGDDGRLIRVKQDERAIGFPTPRLEVNPR